MGIVPVFAAGQQGGRGILQPGEQRAGPGQSRRRVRAGRLFRLAGGIQPEDAGIFQLPGPVAAPEALHQR